MTVLNDFLRIFKTPSPLVLAAEELAEAELDLLKAETGVEFAKSVVQFNRTRIERLKEYLAIESK